MFKKTLHLGTNLLKNELVSGSLYVFSGSIVGNVLAFLLNLFLARNLSYADYAAFASLLSIITLAAIPANSINTVISKFATKLFVKNQDDSLKTLYLLFLKFIFGLSFFVAILFLVMAFPFKGYLRIDNIWYVVFSGIVIATFYLNGLNAAFLQSMLKFKFIALINIGGSILKLSVGVGLVLLGYRVWGGLGALFAMMFGMYLAAYFPLSKVLRVKASAKKIQLDKKEILTYAIPAFATMLFLTSFITSDVILVKHFFSPKIAGFYAGLSLMGRVIYYFTFPIPVVMFPLLVKRHTKGLKFNNLFYLALGLVALPSIVITFFYFIFPDFSINLFLGGREYLYNIKYLGLFGIFLTLFSLVNVCVNLFLSLGKTKVSIPVITAAIAQIVLIYIFHSNFYQVIAVSLFALSILLLILLYLFFKNNVGFRETERSDIPLNSP